MADQRRSALIVVADAYEDEKLSLLKAPGIDAGRLSRLLEGQILGGPYNVKVLPNLKGDKIRREIEGFFRNGERNDLLLLYFSGHGYKALDDGRFYLVAPDSDLEYTSSVISGAFVNEQMNKSRSINKIFILDCCYSGAFINLTPKGQKTVDINHEFELDPGTVILTSSTAMQYSFEGNVLRKEGTAEPSGIYTDLMIRGIESEEADTNGDGKITCLELNDYLKNKMRELRHPQTPQIKIERDDVTLVYTKKKGKDQSPTGLVSVDPAKEVDYLLKLGHSKMEEGKYDLAVDASEQVLKIDAHNAAALFIKAQCLRMMHRYEESIKFFDETLIVTNKNPKVLFQKGLLLRSMGRHSDAYWVFWNFTIHSKLSLMFPSFLGRIIDRENDTVQAAKINYRELDAIIHHPKKALSYWQEKLKSTRDGHDLDRKLKRTSTIEPLNNVGYLLHKLGRDQEALHYLEKFLVDYPDDVYALTTAKSILQNAELQLDLLKSKDDGDSIQQREHKKFLISKLNVITKKCGTKQSISDMLDS